MPRLLLLTALVAVLACNDRRPPADVPSGGAGAVQPADSVTAPKADSAPLQADSVMARDTATTM